MIRYRGIVTERTEDCPFGEFGAVVIAPTCTLNCKGCCNQHLKDTDILHGTPESIVAAIKRNPLHSWCVLGGLEWSEEPEELTLLVEAALRAQLKVLVYTGLSLEQFKEKMKYARMERIRGCYIKYGDYRMDRLPGVKYYGIQLASNNQAIIRW